MPRHLPVLRTQDPEDQAAEERSPGSWVVVGAVLGFTLWLPLLAVAFYVIRAWSRWLQAGGRATEPSLLLAQLSPILLSLVLACGGAGALVGRFGGRAKALHAAASGVSMALAVGIFSLFVSEYPSWLVAALGISALVLVAGFSALAGGWLGVRKRPNVALRRSP